MNKENELKDILLNFIKEQGGFNNEQRGFNQKIDKKIDKVQYFLEETIAEHTKMFFSEQIELKGKVDELNTEVYNLKNDLINLSSSFKLIQKT